MYDNEFVKHDTALDHMADEYRLHMLKAINSDDDSIKSLLIFSAQNYASAMVSYVRLYPIVSYDKASNKINIQNAHIIQYDRYINNLLW